MYHFCFDWGNSVWHCIVLSAEFPSVHYGHFLGHSDLTNYPPLQTKIISEDKNTPGVGGNSSMLGGNSSMRLQQLQFCTPISQYISRFSNMLSDCLATASQWTARFENHYQLMRESLNYVFGITKYLKRLNSYSSSLKNLDDVIEFSL